MGNGTEGSARGEETERGQGGTMHERTRGHFLATGKLLLDNLPAASIRVKQSVLGPYAVADFTAWNLQRSFKQ